MGSPTCLADFEVSVTISEDESGWHGTGQLAKAGDSKNLETFCELDELFQLRFPDDSTGLVMVAALTSTGGFTLAGPV
jgi:hypothetical protein